MFISFIIAKIMLGLTLSTDYKDIHKNNTFKF